MTGSLSPVFLRTFLAKCLPTRDIYHTSYYQAYDKGLEIITRLRKNLKNKLISLVDRILLRKRGIIESVKNKLKNSCQIEHHRHRSLWNFLPI
ncbi:Transposase [Neochlamydia sp. TUME1]|nr:Transposase [Neochlamydia sp. TUME1]